MQDKGPECREMMPVANPGCATLVSHAPLLRVHHGQSLAGAIRGCHERHRPTSLGWSTLSSSRTFVTRLPGKKRSKAGVVHGRFACSKSATLPGKTWRMAGSRNHASHDDLHL